MEIRNWLKRKIIERRGMQMLEAGEKELREQKNQKQIEKEKTPEAEDSYQIDMSKIFGLNKGGSTISVESFDKKAMLIYYMAQGKTEGKHYFPIANFKEVRDLRIGEIRDNFNKYMETFLTQCRTPSQASKNFYNTFYTAKMNQPEYRLELTPEFEEIFGIEHYENQFQVECKTPFALSEERKQVLEETLKKQREGKNSREQFSTDLKFEGTKIPIKVEEELTEEDVKEILNNTDRNLLTKPLSDEEIVNLAQERIKRIQLARKLDKKSIVQKCKPLLIKELLIEDIQTKYIAPYEQTASELLQKSNILVENTQSKKQTRFDVYQQYEDEIMTLRRNTNMDEENSIQIREKTECQTAILTDFWKEKVEAYRREEDLLIQKYNTIAIKKGHTPFQEENEGFVQE